jgi:hypothetical protein
MSAESQDPIREEAQRLVAVALTAASAAANGLAGAHLSTGSAECCICPICRLIAAMRDPSPEFADRLAEGAADLAAGVASLLRSLSTAAHHAGGPAAAPADEQPAAPDEADDPWRRATTAPADQPAGDAPARAPMARKAVKKAAPRPPRDTATAPATGQDEGDEGTEDVT